MSKSKRLVFRLKMKLCVCLALLTAVSVVEADGWKPAEAPLMTQWGKDLDPQNVHPEYPRPQLERPQWVNLNGLWELSIGSKRAQQFSFDQQILVPFPVESALSGVKTRVDDDTIIRYRRSFAIPDSWAGQHVMLNFGASDWQTTVTLNGKQLGTHRGGYDPFSFDITAALEPKGDQILQVTVTDPTDTGTEPRGKQTLNPGGIYYTPSSGIWQTVWIEPVPEKHITRVSIVTDPARAEAHIRAEVENGSGLRLRSTALDGEDQVAQSVAEVGHEMVLKIPHERLWSPRSAFLYRLRIELLPQDSNRPIDEVSSYFGMRRVSVQTVNGARRICLNGKPIFVLGVLDQGYWPDGLYTSPSDEALQNDLVTVKDLGFDAVRKHVKVEPDRYYYWCDKLGLMVWQDMPSGGTGISAGDADWQRAPESAEEYENELKRMISERENHPSIIAWVLFNEGWGQYDTARLTALAKGLDPTRLVDSASGWADRGVGDVVDMHSYPGPDSPPADPKRAAVLGEFGGLGLAVPGHQWSDKPWSYRGVNDADALNSGVADLFASLKDLETSPGLSAAFYTQLTDVETEQNGLMTYDRQLKVNADTIRAATTAVYSPPPTVMTVVPTSIQDGLPWHYTCYKPGDDWAKPAYDASEWTSGLAGFGTKGTPGAVVRTQWDSSDIWMRRSITIPAGTKWHDPRLLIHHDDEAQVFIDGTQVALLPGFLTGYRLSPISHEELLTPGKHVLAIHCHQSGGGQFIDAGIVDLR